MGLDSALELIESVKDYRVLFVGDSIIDEYHYGHPLGKSPKEHIIPVKYTDKEIFSGGVVAAARHTKSFCKEVKVQMGDTVTRKVRVVDRIYLRKLSEVHYEEKRVGVPRNEFGFADVTVAADFGHGAITHADAVSLGKTCAFLAVNTQTNSSNIGFNLITKYPRADYIVIDEFEARLAAGDREGHIEDVMHKLAHGRCEKFVVTLGVNGAIGYERGNFYKAKALTSQVVDTMGAGDAFFAVTAPMAKMGGVEDLLLVGNAAGALKTQIVGHREPVTKEALIGYLKAHG